MSYSTINARCEEIDKKPAFREAFARSRCLVPLDSFYEWKHVGKVAARARLMIAKAERWFPVRVRIVILPGASASASTACIVGSTTAAAPMAGREARMRGAINDAVAVYFRDATLAAAFVVRGCAPATKSIAEGFFRVREDDPVARIAATHHKTP